MTRTYKYLKPVKTVLWALASILIGLTACKKSGTDCFTNSGKIIRQVRSVAEFDSIDMENYVNVILTQDSVTGVEVEAGENVQDGIETKVTNHQLVISNHLLCNWLRDYSNPINVYVSVKNLKKIYYNSSGNLSTRTPIRSSNLKVDAYGGAGSIDLNLDINGFGYFILGAGTMDFNLHGKCSICYIFSGGYGPIMARDLETGYDYVTNNGSNDIYVNAKQYLSADIESIGNIYYTGNPDTVAVKINGKGQVIEF